MAAKKTNTSKAAENMGGGHRYTLAELVEHAEDLFDVKAEVMAGALYGMVDPCWTVSEAKQKIEQFMKAKVDE